MPSTAASTQHHAMHARHPCRIGLAAPCAAWPLLLQLHISCAVARLAARRVKNRSCRWWARSTATTAAAAAAAAGPSVTFACVSRHRAPRRAAQQCFARQFLYESRLKGSAMHRHFVEGLEMALIFAKNAKDIKISRVNFDSKSHGYQWLKPCLCFCKSILPCHL